MTKILKSFCIGHTAPLFRPDTHFKMVCPFSLGLPGELVVDDNRFNINVDGATLAEYSQLFALSEMIQAGEVVADELFLFQYRKFLSPNFGGAASVSPWIRVLRPDEGVLVFPTLEQLTNVNSRIIVGSIFDLGESISCNYARVHVIEDLVMFSAACARNPLLSPEDIRSLASIRGIIPSPALCFIQTDLFIKTMNILKETWVEFSSHYFFKREGYQRRVAGYLMERLHSVLLCKWLMDGTEPDIKVWNRYVVADIAKPAEIPVLPSLAS